MNKVWKWLLLFLGVFLVAFLVALPLLGLGSFGHGYGWMPMMGLRNGGCGLWSGNFGHGFGLFGGGLMMLGMILITLLLVALVVLGINALTRKNHAEITSSKPCSNCGKPVQTGWVACPYCGEKQ